MALRVRQDGHILCAAIHGAEPEDIYIDDAEHYRLSVEVGLFVTEPMEPDPENPGRGGHKAHGEWWLRGTEPEDAVLERRAARKVDPVDIPVCTCDTLSARAWDSMNPDDHLPPCPWADWKRGQILGG